MIALVIPAYNEALTIRIVLESALKHIQTIIVVDDGSTDGTLDIISEYPVIKIVHSVNQGKGAALRHGFEKALELQVSGIITIDADNQHNPQDIPRFIEAHQQYPNDLLIGARLKNREQAPRMRLMANKISDFFVSWAAHYPIADTQSGFRLYPIAMIQQFLKQKKLEASRFGFESEWLIEGVRHGYKPLALAIQSCYPENRRQSYYRPLKDTWHIFRLVSWKLLSHGFCPIGLYRCLTQKPRQF